MRGKTVIDVGTGAGFPGMVLAILEPSARFTLLDSLGKRVDFLREVCEQLGLKNVTCVHARAEEFAAGHRDQVDGLILVGSIFNTICQGAEMENLLRKMPVVLANGTLALPDAYSVMVDDCRGVEMAVEHLVKTGRRNLYYIKDKSTDSAAAKAKGFLSGMAAAGLDADGHVLETGETLEDGIRAVQQLLAEGIRPDGILCGEDLTAAGVLKALLRAGIRVPEETAVVGYDNSTYARLCEPELTSVDNKPEQVALLCVQLLQSRIEHGEDYSSVTLQPELVQRQSS